MEDLIITEFNQIIWKQNDEINIYDISDIRYIDDRISFQIHKDKLIAYYVFKTKKKHKVCFSFDVVLNKIEKSFLGFKYQTYDMLKIDKGKNIYDIIREVKQYFGMTKEDEYKLFHIQRTLEEINYRNEQT